MQNIQFDTSLKRDAALNLGSIQVSGGQLQMSFNQESIYFQAKCLEYHFSDMLEMLIDQATEPRADVVVELGELKRQTQLLTKAQVIE